MVLEPTEQPVDGGEDLGSVPEALRGDGHELNSARTKMLSHIMSLCVRLAFMITATNALHVALTVFLLILSSTVKTVKCRQ